MNKHPVHAAALFLAASMVAGPPAFAQAPAETRISGQSAVAALRDQATFWLSQNQPDRALQTLERLLAVEPENLDALLAAVEAASLSNDTEAARRHLTTFRRIAPGDPRLQRAEEMIDLMTQSADGLAAARQLAAAGRQAEAVQRYRQLGRDGTVPSVIALEFYQVLAGSSEAGYQQAIQELSQRLAASPNDARLARILAELLTYREETRTEGVDRLAELARQPGQRSEVRAPWRQALLWSGDDPETAARIETFQAVFPGSDRELEAKLEASNETGLTPAQGARILGWSEIDAGRLDAAATQFRAALDADPADAESLVGLGVVRKMQNRVPDAREFLNQAITTAPDREEEFRRILGDLSGTAAGGGRGGFVAGPSAAAWTALRRGDLDRADRLARRAAALRGEERQQGELLLGQIALQREDFSTAEQRFRSVLAQRPRQRDALLGLYVALQSQNRFAEAATLQRREGFTPPAAALAARANAIMQSARRVDHPELAVEQLRAAVALDDSTPWPTVDLIRRLKARGDHEEARELERALERRGGAEFSMAAALLAVDDQRYGDAVALFERVPVRLRDAGMNILAAQARREYEVRRVEDAARARQLGALQSLQAMAGQRDPAGLLAPAVIRALDRLDQPAAAVNAARLAVQTNNPLTARARILMAGALIEVRRPDLAQELTGSLARSSALSAEERRELDTILDLETAALVDQNLAASAPEAAEAMLIARAGVRGSAPASTTANLALVRLLVAQNRAPEARRVVEEILERSPRDLEARVALVDVAIAERDFARAHAALVEGAFFHPNDITLTLAEARLSRARGDQAGTLRLVEMAASRRLAQLRADGQVAEAATAATAMSPRAGSAPAARLNDPLTAQVAQELIRARDEAAVWLQGGYQFQGRSGTAGTSRLTTLVAPLEVSTPLPRIGGRLTVGVDMVALQAGQLGTGFESEQTFGTNPLFRPPQFVAPAFDRPRSTNEGVALRLGYTRQNIRAEIGSTPIGFARPTFTGLLEVVPQITERLRLRLTAERSAVTDSMLSYAGYQQAGGGPFWGGVTRTGGRAQLEYAATEQLGFYGGGAVHALRGTNVASNTRWELGGGAFYAVLRQPGQSITVGVDLRYSGYERNSSGFTFGHGGYFSPAHSFTGSLQGEYRAQWGDWTFRGIGSVGLQSFNSASAQVFPTRPDFQAAIEAQAAANPAAFNSRVPGFRASGLTGSVFANLEYAVSPRFRLGAAGRWQRSGASEDASAFLYLRLRLDSPPAELRPLMAGARPAYPSVNDPFTGSYGNGAPELISLPAGAPRPVW